MSLERDGTTAGAACPSHMPMATLLQVNTSGTIAWRRLARQRCYACWCCLLVASAHGAVEYHIRRDDVALPLPSEM